MALSTVISHAQPAPLTRTITAGGIAQVVLCDATINPIAANPQSVNHLPSKIVVLPLAAGGSLVWLDAAGTSNTLVFEAAAPVPFELPGTAKSIEAGTTAGFKIVVAWHTAP
jgi:hypothetical protein